jgi:hypothetical protein
VRAILAAVQADALVVRGMSPNADALRVARKATHRRSTGQTGAVMDPIDVRRRAPRGG